MKFVFVLFLEVPNKFERLIDHFAKDSLFPQDAEGTGHGLARSVVNRHAGIMVRVSTRDTFKASDGLDRPLAFAIALYILVTFELSYCLLCHLLAKHARRQRQAGVT